MCSYSYINTSYVLLHIYLGFKFKIMVCLTRYIFYLVGFSVCVPVLRKFYQTVLFPVSHLQHNLHVPKIKYP